MAATKDGPHRRIPRLQVVVAGTGRDGTMSLARLIGDLAAANGRRWVSEHELYADHVCNLLSRYHETGLELHRRALRDLLAQLPAHAVAGTTYQFALDLLLELHGPRLKLVHLRRRDRAECIRSLAQIIHWRPAMAIHMTKEACRTDLPEYTLRLAAFHFGETTHAAWERMSLDQRLGWHFDKTHRLIERAAPRFGGYLQLDTEDLDRPATVRRLARFLDPSWKRVCPAVHVNSRDEWRERGEFNEAVRRKMLAPRS
ncbi:MAG: hypothetical protein JXB32_14280 [Deltaproteobacteria bacterium]|nr:hypothetical protein [Deltaproteobacteria bacterium]